MGATKLAQATSARAGQPNAMRTGIVVAVTATGVQVSVGGGTINAGIIGGATAGVAVGAVVGVFKQGASWLVQGALAGPGGGAVNGQILAGVLRRTNGTNVSGLGVGSESLSNRSVTCTIPAGQLARISFGVNVTYSVANGALGMRIRDGGLSGTQFGSGHGGPAPTAGFTYEAYAEGWLLGDGLPHTWVLTVQNFSASGTLSISQAQAAPMLDHVALWGPPTGVQLL